MLTEQKPTQSKTAAPSHHSEIKHKEKYKGENKTEGVFFIIIVPSSVYNLNISKRNKSNAYWVMVENKERQVEMLTLSRCI